MSEALTPDDDRALDAAKAAAAAASIRTGTLWHVFRYRSGRYAASDSDPHMIPATRVVTYAIGAEVEHNNRTIDSRRR